MANVQSVVTGNGDQRRTLVVIFLRGGADGLNMVAPLQDDGYYNARPRIAISRSKAVPLDGFYGLNPLLRELAPAYHDGALAIIHAAGSEDSTRSHFEAQDLMEHGGLAGGGWLGRFLRTEATPLVLWRLSLLAKQFPNLFAARLPRLSSSRSTILSWETIQ